MGLGDVTHTRKSHSGTKSGDGISTAKVLERSPRVVSKFNEPLKHQHLRRENGKLLLLISMALEKLMRVSLENQEEVQWEIPRLET